MQDVVKYNVLDGPVESITIASTDKGVCWIKFGSGDSMNCSLLRWTKKWFQTGRVEFDPQSNQEAISQLEEYFQKKRKHFDLPVDMRGTPFQLKVWKELLNIPFAQTRSYKEVAVALGAAKAVRAVGNANHRNPLSIIVPCHRVIGSNGALVGYGGGVHIKKYLLSLEQENGLNHHKNVI